MFLAFLIACILTIPFVFILMKVLRYNGLEKNYFLFFISMIIFCAIAFKVAYIVLCSIE